MSKHYTTLATLIALAALFSLSVYGQSEQIGIEDQPIAASGQEESAPQGEQPATHTGPIAIDIAPSLKRIDSAISLLIPQEDEEERQRSSEREIRDLQAQEHMAWWAMWMLVASAAGVAITFVGLLLIWRTLHHTKIAAEASKAMVDEAKATTQAARDTIVETREIGRKQTRAYLTCIGGSFSIVNNWLYLDLTIKNVGQSPAVSTAVIGKIDIVDVAILDGFRTRYKGDSIPDEARRIASGQEEKLTLVVRAADMEPAPTFADIAQPLMEVDAQVWIEWTDVFGEVQRIVADLHTRMDDRINHPNVLEVRSQIEWTKEFPSINEGDE